MRVEFIETINIEPLVRFIEEQGAEVTEARRFRASLEEVFVEYGHLVNDQFGPYNLLKAREMPVMDVIFMQTDEPSGPFGAKSVAEISIDGVAPALVSAIHDATRIWIRNLPATPERVRRALNQTR